MIETPILSRNYQLELVASKYSVQDQHMVSSGPLPHKLKEVKELVLLVNTTLNDNLDTFLIPDIPVNGQILHHNNTSVTYEDSSQFLFDNAHKFNDPSNPLTITLQFRLGIEDDGTSMDDLLLKANHLKLIGCFKFKFYIFKIVTHQKLDKFKMPPVEYYKYLNCIGFRFDTDIIPTIPFESREESKHNYIRTVNYHIPITIWWLSKDLEELHLGQKIRLLGTKYVDYKFPKLVNHSFECYDHVTENNWTKFFEKNDSIKCLTLRNFQAGYYRHFEKLDKITLIGFETILKSVQLKGNLWSAKMIYLHGVPVEFTSVAAQKRHVETETLFYLWSTEVTKTTTDSLKLLSKVYKFELVEIPFLPYCQTSLKSDAYRRNLHRNDHLVEIIPPSEFIYETV
ncbi:hypothetical protein DFJ63DRAFT_337226 [Scheffersomyces coipomensis]|uniref:uncharacterized protein n=1 Tax=Scheffersomyces coipomensis TaxID=1788519 RepID=UPI00315D5815